MWQINRTRREMEKINTNSKNSLLGHRKRADEKKILKMLKNWHKNTEKFLKDENKDRKSDTKEAQRKKERLTDSFMEVERKIWSKRKFKMSKG